MPMSEAAKRVIASPTFVDVHAECDGSVALCDSDSIALEYVDSVDVVKALRVLAMLEGLTPEALRNLRHGLVEMNLDADPAGEVLCQALKEVGGAE